jgi:hypothetical protein
MTLAKDMDITYYPSKDMTKEILERDNYDYSSGIQVEKFLASGSRQIEILERTEEVQKAEGSWVTDRTFLDLAAYAILELTHSDITILRRIYTTCQENIGSYTHLFLCPWVERTAIVNNKRTLNMWYQFQVHSILWSLVREWDVQCHILEQDGDARLEEIKAIID